MLYCSSECGSISIIQLRIIYCNTHVYTFHVCLCLLAPTFVRNSTYLFKCSFQIYQKGIEVFIRSSKVWFKTTWCAKGPVTRCNFSCNLQRYSTLSTYKIGKYTFPSHFANIFLTYQTFVTNLHLLRVELRCKLPGKLHRVTGPLEHHVVLNHSFELLINTTMLFSYFWKEHFNKLVELQTNVSEIKHKHKRNVCTCVVQ